MKPFLMGAETEYSISARFRDGTIVSPQRLIGPLIAAVKKDRRWMADAACSLGCFLEQGGRLYAEIEGHPEYATPEVATPAQVAVFDKAGEWVMRLAGERMMRETPNLELSIWKANLGTVFPDRITFGSHESLLCWLDDIELVAPMLIPHLVSRIVYAGAGCLSDHPAGMGFELSQRSRHIVCAQGDQTTRDRAIFCTRIRKVTDRSTQGWTRVHLISKDSQRSTFGIYLTFGVTGLLFWLVNHGTAVGRGLALRDPVKALRTLSLDPWLKTRVALADGRRLSALEIQEAYLAEVEPHVRRGDAPEWAPNVVRHWAETLRTLAKNPLEASRRLDPYLKLSIYDHQLRRARVDWKQFHGALKLLARLRQNNPPNVIRAVLAEAPTSLTAEETVQFDVAQAEIAAHDHGTIDRLRLAVRMRALELNYHELGGLYDRLASAGEVESVVTTNEEIDRAATTPPPDGRAAFRGATVAAHHGEPGWECNWGRIAHLPSRTMIDTSDPFAAEYRTTSLRRAAEMLQGF